MSEVFIINFPPRFNYPGGLAGKIFYGGKYCENEIE